MLAVHLLFVQARPLFDELVPELLEHVNGAVRLEPVLTGFESRDIERVRSSLKE